MSSKFTDFDPIKHITSDGPSHAAFEQFEDELQDLTKRRRLFLTALQERLAKTNKKCHEREGTNLVIHVEALSFVLIDGRIARWRVSFVPPSDELVNLDDKYYGLTSLNGAIIRMDRGYYESYELTLNVAPNAISLSFNLHAHMKDIHLPPSFAEWISMPSK